MTRGRRFGETMASTNGLSCGGKDSVSTRMYGARYSAAFPDEAQGLEMKLYQLFVVHHVRARLLCKGKDGKKSHTQKSKS